MNYELLDRPIGQLVAEKPARSIVFERWGIDYCCGGKKPLQQVLLTKQLNSERILEEIDQIDHAVRAPEIDWTKESMTSLCDHIYETHHEPMRAALPRLSALVGKVADRHGAKDARLIQLREVFEGFQSELLAHMEKEDRILFPMIRMLDSGANVHSVAGPIEVMLAEHDDAGEALASMKNLTDGFAAAPDACNSHRAMLDGLAELESDMHRHIHKENNILFPRALAASKV
ncbi:MAG: iron-sulfur cluster repair di-iron protein [Fimbriimonas sp.]|nr:iron-sulfur cluster repair di-iron protein [Fimbriimonas sp.]